MKFNITPQEPPFDNWEKVQTAARKAAPKALKVLIELMHNTENTYLKEVDGTLARDGKGQPFLLRPATPPGVIVSCVRELMDRAYGKPATMTTEAQEEFTAAVRSALTVGFMDARRDN